MKRSAIKRRPLSDSTLRSLEPDDKDYQEQDGQGLYFRVKKNGGKSWLLRYKRPSGKWAWMGLGGFPAVSGKAARAEAKRLLELASHGEDLRVYKDGIQAAEEVYTFRDAAETWYQRKVDAGRAKGTLIQMRKYLDKDILPVLGDKPIGEVSRADCARVQEGLEQRGAHVIAGKVRRWMNQMFSLAIGQGRCELNPASELRHIASEAHKEKPYPHLLEPELPVFLKKLRQSESRWETLIMVRLVLRTACRPGMARLAEWSEMDLENALWTVPADKMKMRRDHIIPLPRQTVAELKELHEATGRCPYVFPGYGPKNPTMSENTVNKALRLIGYKGKLVGHGSRHTASTLLREHGWQKDYVEAQLAHMEGGVAGVYNKAQYLEQRRVMMQWYSDYFGLPRLC